MGKSILQQICSFVSPLQNASCASLIFTSIDLNSPHLCKGKSKALKCGTMRKRYFSCIQLFYVNKMLFVLYVKIIMLFRYIYIYIYLFCYIISVLFTEMQEIFVFFMPVIFSVTDMLNLSYRKTCVNISDCIRVMFCILVPCFSK